MDRRHFLATTGAAAGFGLVGGAYAEDRRFEPRPGNWRTFEVVTRVEIVRPNGLTKVWIPIPSVDDVYQRTLDNQWSGTASVAHLAFDGKYGAQMLYAEFPDSEKAPKLELVSRFQAQSRATDWGQRIVAQEEPATQKFWTEATPLMPVNGLVRKTALEATRGKTSDLEKTRALYEWVVANTYREPKVPGCGIGDINAMLETGNMGGKCGDINALFVGLNRAVGIPARDVYGIRVCPSEFGYKELGANGNVTRAQHCRAEVYLQAYGWVAMDPADVGKVMRLETAEWIKDSRHPVVAPVKTSLFGGWEGNWLGYNRAHSVALPNSNGPRLAFFMYPQAENAGGRFDPLDPDGFKYSISAREIKTYA
jgi:transglutaminase-like putative cysteine protease